jgi:hypothetical protein
MRCAQYQNNSLRVRYWPLVDLVCQIKSRLLQLTPNTMSGLFRRHLTHACQTAYPSSRRPIANSTSMSRAPS